MPALCSATIPPGMPAGAAGVEVPLATSAASGQTFQDVHRRIDNMIRLKTFARRLSAHREWDFWRTIDAAHLAARSGDADAIAKAVFSLDLLSCELCDE